MMGDRLERFWHSDLCGLILFALTGLALAFFVYFQV